MQTPARKAVEIALIGRVAAVRGGTVQPAGTDPPDGYLVEPDGTVIPAEAVAAFNRPPGGVTPPKRGSLAAQAEAEVGREEARLRAAGHTSIMSYVHDDHEAIVAPADEMPRLPLPSEPMNGKARDAATLAIWAKAQKGYAPGTILIVHYHGWALNASDLRAVGQYARLVAPGFREVWIYSDVEDVVQHATA
jgi:hypothetical protein